MTFPRGQVFKHNFLLADVTKPLLGVDFFNANNIGIDTKGKRMFDLSNGTRLGGGQNSDATICSLTSAAGNGGFHEILAEFPDILSPSFVNKNVRHGIKHYIPTSCPPIRSRPRRLDDQKLALSLIHI